MTFKLGKRNISATTSTTQVDKKSKARPAKSQLRICIFKVTDCAADVWRMFEGTSVPLWQLQFDHAGKQSVLYKFAMSFDEFLTKVGAKQHPKVSNMEDVLTYYNAKLVETDSTDSDQVGFVPFRS
jgi:hypothetical protein